MSDAIKVEIKKLEDRRFQAMIDSDFHTLEGLLDDGLVYTHSTGQSDTHAEYILEGPLSGTNRTYCAHSEHFRF